MNRRSFFTALAGLPVIPAIAKAPAPVAHSPLPTIVSTDELIRHAFRLIGVIMPGEMMSESDMKTARLTLSMMLRDWAASDIEASDEQVCYYLAMRLAPMYGPRGGPRIQARRRLGDGLPFDYFYDEAGNFTGCSEAALRPPPL